MIGKSAAISGCISINGCSAVRISYGEDVNSFVPLSIRKDLQESSSRMTIHHSLR